MDSQIQSKAKKNLEEFLTSLELSTSESKKNSAYKNRNRPVVVYLGFPTKKHHYYYVYAGKRSHAKKTFRALREEGKVDRSGFLPYVVFSNYFREQSDVSLDSLTPLKSKKLRSFIKFLKVGQQLHQNHFRKQLEYGI